MIKVLIVDDHAIVRAGLKQLLATAGDIEVLGEASTGQEALGCIQETGLDVLVTDLSMPGISGEDLIRRIRLKRPQLPILVLSMHQEGILVARAINAGASGYVTKDSEPEILIAAIRKIARGDKYIDPAVAADIVFRPQHQDDNPMLKLSGRELQVLDMILAGKSINEIGADLNLSNKTISTHKMRLMQKLGLHNDMDIFRFALEHRLIE